MLKTYIPFISIYLKFYISSIQYINILAGSGFINQGGRFYRSIGYKLFCCTICFLRFKILIQVASYYSTRKGTLKWCN